MEKEKVSFFKKEKEEIKELRHRLEEIKTELMPVLEASRDLREHALWLDDLIRELYDNIGRAKDIIADIQD